jgi:hypothetical protein
MDHFSDRMAGVDVTGKLRALALAVTILLAPAAYAADPVDCSRLPSSARRPRPCNPQQECSGLIRPDVKGAALDAARADCARLPTSGTCYGPNAYNPQAECREKQQRK